MEICCLKEVVGVGSDWFSKGVLKRVGDGGSSSFWFDPWVGDIPLKIQFQSLFQLSDQQLDLVGEMGYWLDLEWHWVFRWRRDLSVPEIGLLEALLSAVQTTPLLGVVDSWSWRHDSTGTYSVKSAYMVLSAGSVASDLDSLLARVWKSWAPSKVIVFSWKLLQDRVPSRPNLLRRRVIRDHRDSFCAFCGASLKSVDHLFVTCDSISPVWYSLFRWLGFRFVSPPSISSVFQGFLGFRVGRKIRLEWLLIWHATVWTIWNSRNDVIFARGTVSVESLVDKVKFSSWKWYLAKNLGSPCSFYEWEVQPILC
ncbi:hypothetical protein TSUD_198490 [Trifolium subterraneum]|uniref:Reverse transcriptase zinc-binding domain-containing protein n=1 Tax=Trifolium subterraneum TaxID=3900 RepID=A0A2Z6NM47_TRISU|nr:hypothetical protein TSUD_198490 [Trifolium subterraneum]